MIDDKNNSLMSLRGQGGADVGQAGYAMAALLVALAVMTVMMSVAMPVWRHEAQREKEDELVFIGTQYVRGIRLYNAKFRAFPSSIDQMVEQHCLRQHYKDPITKDEFDLVGIGTPQPGTNGQAGQTGQTGARGSATSPSNSSPLQQSAVNSSSAPGGILGVRSKSKDESIRVYLGRNHYNEWTFIYVNQAPVGPGGNGFPGRGGPNGRGTGPVGPNGQPIGPGGGPGRGRDGPNGPNGPGRGFGPPNGTPFPFPPGGRGRGGGL
jgi:type II secretory pathway pseudopilin PulG